MQPPAPLSDAQFKRWRDLIEARTGMQLPERQRNFLQSQLSSRMRKIASDSYDAYYERATAGVDGLVEWGQLVDQLVIKETQFFRHRPSLELVRQFLRDKIQRCELQDSFEIWSVGCATGEEPYSLAMIASDCFDEAEIEPYFGVTALDISVQALRHGRRGLYSERKTALLTEAERMRYMTASANGWQVNADIRERICFSHGNLLQLKRMPENKMDVIFCQNLLIYFRRWRRREILNELVRRLKPGGLLVIGHGEAVDWQNPTLQRVNGVDAQAYILNL